MKRLNFGQVKAEKSSMQRADPFFTMILFIFSALVISFFAFDYQLSGIDVEKQKVLSLSGQLRDMQVVNEALKLEARAIVQNLGSPSQRSIASLSGPKEISFDRLYKSQLVRAIQNQRPSEILPLTKKILDTSTDRDLLAQALYAKTKLSCHITYQEDLCFSDTESLVLQFPESKWAGESLIQLSQLYLKQKKFKEAESVLKIVKLEFPNERELIKRINLIEKQNL